MTRREGHAVVFKRVVRDERGNHYLDVSSDAAADDGVSLLIPLVVAKGEPKSATSSVASASSAATTPTASDLRDVLCAAEAVLLDASTDSTSRMKASSSSKARGFMSASNALNGTKLIGSFMGAPYFVACGIVMILAFANFWWRSVPLGVACVLASAFLLGVAARGLARAAGSGKER